jgi:hypothetical protein
MTEEYDEAQMGEDDTMVAPGAPTPLTALEVRSHQSIHDDLYLILYAIGRFWLNKA